MIKAFSAIAAAAFIAAALTVLPGFAPQVEASVPQALAKGDRLEVRTAGKDCSQQSWPNFEASCLRATGSKSMVREVRLVTADRTPHKARRTNTNRDGNLRRDVADWQLIAPRRS